jgi:carbamoylphosphate synthase large subunit
MEEAEAIVEKLGYPCVVRPAYTMGGTGGGITYNPEEFRAVVARGLAASMVSEVLIEESVAGWEELEVEVVRDANNKLISVCFIENIDVKPYIDQISAVTVYNWNRVYPRELVFDINLEKEGFSLMSSREFKGYSHDKIRKEVYER